MALDVAMEMRCMKAFYELDEGVEVGEGIGGRRMEIIDGEGDSEEECGELVVVAIMSKGMVERRWRGEGGNGDTVIKARVLLGKQEDMQS